MKGSPSFPRTRGISPSALPVVGCGWCPSVQCSLWKIGCAPHSLLPHSENQWRNRACRCGWSAVPYIPLSLIRYLCPVPASSGAMPDAWVLPLPDVGNSVWMTDGEKRKIQVGRVALAPLSYQAGKTHSPNGKVPAPMRWCCRLCPARNRTTDCVPCSPWTMLLFPAGTGICTKGCFPAASRVSSPDFADNLPAWLFLLLGCS